MQGNTMELQFFTRTQLLKFKFHVVIQRTF